jgi:hypothetical protein
VSIPTPFFAAFGSLLFGQRRLSSLEKRLRRDASSPSFSQYEQAFGQYVPKALLSRSAQGPNSRQRLFPPMVIFWAFLAQVLERGSSCRDALRRIGAWLHFENPAAPALSTNTGGYCQARARLADAQLEKIGDHLAGELQRRQPSSELWLGRSVKIIDGTSASMPDTPSNQAAWPQQSNQKPGCGFPLVTLVGLFSLGSGALLHLLEANKHVSEVLLARELWARLTPKDVALADRNFCSYADLNAICAAGADAVMRLHAHRRADFRQGRRLGPNERLLTWTKPRACPAGFTPEAFAAMPPTLRVRMIRYRIETPGFRTKNVVLITTLLDPIAYPASALQQLYFQRWTIELHFREIKMLLGLDILRCLSPEMVRKEIAMHRVAYNLVRILMQEAGLVHHLPLARISFKGTVDSLHHYADAIHALGGQPRRQAAMLRQLLQALANDPLPERPGRSEPRAKKRRAKNYQLLTKPRKKMKILQKRDRHKKQS